MIPVHGLGEPSLPARLTAMPLHEPGHDRIERAVDVETLDSSAGLGQEHLRPALASDSVPQLHPDPLELV